MSLALDNSGVCSAYYDGPNACPAGNPLLLFLSIISSLKPQFPQFCSDRKIKTEYDFIVVGGGSAGAVVAGRLSEVESWNVLLVEAGPEEPVGALVPSMTGSFLGSDLNWKYRTTGEKHACLRSNGSCSWPRGRNLGGSGVHNGMMYMRGHAKDYDGWAIPGWTWNDVLPYFKRSENNREFAGDRRHHGVDGPLHVGRFPHQPSPIKDMLKAAQEAGFGVSEDLNGQKITGFNVAQTTSVNGTRVSSATAFLRPVRNRKNLHVIVNAHVTKILFQNPWRPTVATGVQFIWNGLFHQVEVNKEVVLSAGAVGSPHILLLSGIGPAKHLKKKGVELVKDLPGVGQNLQNHVSYTIRYLINAENTDFFQSAAEQYISNRTGPTSSTGLSQFTGMLSSKYTTPDHPDIQFYFRGYSGSCSAKKSGQREIGIVPTYLHPQSRGTLSLATKDPFKHPSITQNYLSSLMDVKGVLAGIEMARKLFASPAMQKYEPRLMNDPIEACKEHDLETPAYWECALRYNTDPENHQVGSCKMGLDDMAVVDPMTLKVRGVHRVRVADGSVIPKITSGNVGAPIMMVGERVADFIKRDHLNEHRQHKTEGFLPVAKNMEDKKLYPYAPYLY